MAMMPITFPKAESVKAFLGLLKKENLTMQVKISGNDIKFNQISANGDLLLHCIFSLGGFQGSLEDMAENKIYGNIYKM
jgi:hypothetical protein